MTHFQLKPTALAATAACLVVGIATSAPAAAVKPAAVFKAAFADRGITF